MVIKVKCGDTLRRFNARINGSGELELDMAELRAKIFGLFSLPSEAELTLTYVDEDGDAITLADDDDLREVTKQDLKFLRINVQLSNEKPSVRSSGSSTPLRSPRVSHPLQNVNSAVYEIFKTVPEPLLDAISKLTLDIASKASSSNTVLTELVDRLSKVGQSVLDASQSPAVNGTSRQGQISEDPAPPSVSTDQSPLTDAGLRYILQQSSFSDTARKVGQEIGATNNGKLVSAQDIPQPAAANLESAADSFLSGSSGAKSNPAAVNDVAVGDKNHQSGLDAYFKRKGAGFDAPPAFDDFKRNLQQFNNYAMGGSASNECPFSGVAMGNDSAVPTYVPPGPWSHTPFGATSGTFHKGVQCDGCGVHPITGPRFKSTVKEDYDLCSICFSKMGNEADYVRMDRPVSYRHPRCVKTLGVGGPALPNIWRNRGMKFGRPHKLDSRFILDVNILDGTIMAPSTPFTKIWRMRNNGTVPWPSRLQLLWIGGDRFSDAGTVDIEVPAEGVPVDGELDIAVDFIAPDLPGRYISYWRMQSLSSGMKFGQRVWVLIQVDASLKDSVCGSLQGLNLNLPPAGSSPSNFMDMGNGSAVDVSVSMTPLGDQQTTQQVPDYGVNNDLLVAGDVPVSASSAFAPPEALLAALTQQAPKSPAFVPPKLEEPSSSSVSYPIIDQGVPASPPRKEPSASSVAYPVIDQGVPESSSPFPVGDDVLFPAFDKQPATTTEKTSVSSSVAGKVLEQSLLKELEEMGFNQVDLNKEVLRLNEYDLEKSVEDLCGVSEWDPILEELQEMGFRDSEMNKKLLKKNNGSIKRVVMDLLTGEKA